ncbi:MAG: hypothetical protein F6K50_00435 [Moorea sp. SIO3I7]|nr:hypothetical protein [Moorena sp. SIO3I7]
MSQDVITKEKSTERLNPPLPIQPWSVDAEADRLMDDLFGDLYQMIENGCELRCLQYNWLLPSTPRCGRNILKSERAVS